MKFKLTLLCIGIITCCFFQQALAQNISVSGKVKNKATGEPLASATVAVSGSTTTTVTDASGNFSINTVKGATLVICKVGKKAESRSL